MIIFTYFLSIFIYPGFTYALRPASSRNAPPVITSRHIRLRRSDGRVLASWFQSATSRCRDGMTAYRYLAEAEDRHDGQGSSRGAWRGGGAYCIGSAGQVGWGPWRRTPRGAPSAGSPVPEAYFYCDVALKLSVSMLR